MAAATQTYSLTDSWTEVADGVPRVNVSLLSGDGAFINVAQSSPSNTELGHPLKARGVQTIGLSALGVTDKVFVRASSGNSLIVVTTA